MQDTPKDTPITQNYMDKLYDAIIAADGWLKKANGEGQCSLTDPASHALARKNRMLSELILSLDNQFKHTAFYTPKLISGLTQITNKKDYISSENASAIRAHASTILGFLQRDDVRQWIQNNKSDASQGMLENIKRLEGKINDTPDYVRDTDIKNNPKGWVTFHEAYKRWEEAEGEKPFDDLTFGGTVQQKPLRDEGENKTPQANTDETPTLDVEEFQLSSNTHSTRRFKPR